MSNSGYQAFSTGGQSTCVGGYSLLPLTMSGFILFTCMVRLYIVFVQLLNNIIASCLNNHVSAN